MRIIILTVVLLVGFGVFNLKISAQEKKVTIAKYDILFKFIDSLNRDIVIGQMPAADTSNIERVKNAIDESKISYSDGNICYSPDRTFEIVMAEGTDCRYSHCICLKAAQLYFTNTGKSLDLDQEFLNIDTIFKIDSNKYLALQSSRSCQGTSVSYKQATFFSISDNKIIYHPINDDVNLISLFQYETEELDKYPFVLKFDVNNKRLIYSYVSEGDDTGNYSHPKTEVYITGYYEYRDGAFYNHQITSKKLNTH